MLDSGLTHMNGRLYDPVLARFVSADPHIDNPFDLQSLNRYSYVNNNPLGFTDPSGYFKIFGKKWSWIRDKVVKPVVAIVAVVFIGPAVYNSVFWSLAGSTSLGVIGGGVIAGAAAGATAGAITGGLYGGAEGALKGALFGGISGGIFGGIDAYFGAGTYNGSLKGAARYGWSPERIAANSLAGGVTSELRGGKFRDGFKFSFATSALSYMAVSMRADTVDNMAEDPRNSTRRSVGAFGDGNHTAGSRFDEANPEALSPLGGNPNKAYLGLTWGGKATGLGSFYGVGSWQDRLLEAYGGVHDYFNKPTWYNQFGALRQDMSSVSKFIGEITNILNVGVATPFVPASVLPSYSYSVLGR